MGACSNDNEDRKPCRAISEDGLWNGRHGVVRSAGNRMQLAERQPGRNYLLACRRLQLDVDGAARPAGRAATGWRTRRECTERLHDGLAAAAEMPLAHGRHAVVTDRADLE